MQGDKVKSQVPVEAVPGGHRTVISQSVRAGCSLSSCTELPGLTLGKDLPKAFPFK